MSGQLTEKQHCVWRRYLRPWKQKPQIGGVWTCILSQKKVAMVGVMDVAQASYFYKIEELNKEQLNFLRKFVSTQPHGVKELGMQLLELYESYAELMEKKRNGDMVLLSIPNIDHKLKEIEINTFEHLNGEVESLGFALIDCRSIEDVKSMSPKDLEKSMYYLWIQYMRTRRMKERFVDSMMERPNMHEIGEKTWPFMLFLITSNLWQTGF